MTLEKLTDLEIDAIREIASVGAGHASMALASLTNKSVEISFPGMSICPLEGITACIDEPEKEFANIYLHIDGEAPDCGFEVCSMFFTFPIESAVALAKMMQGDETTATELSEMDRSTLMELGNILAGSYLTAIADYMDLKLVESLPYLASDMLDAVVDPIVVRHASEIDYAFVLNTLLKIEEQEVAGYLVVLFFSPAHKLLKDIKYLQEMER
jgi:chemotaxis protein CheC